MIYWDGGVRTKDRAQGMCWEKRQEKINSNKNTQDLFSNKNIQKIYFSWIGKACIIEIQKLAKSPSQQNT